MTAVGSGTGAALRVPQRIDAWLFEPAPPERLAVLRILVGAFAVIYLAVRLPVFLALADDRGELEPIGPLWWLTGPFPSTVVKVLVIGVLLAGAVFTAGAAARVSGPVFAVGMLVITTYRASWGQVLWIENLMVLQLLIVAFAPCADAWAVRSGRVDGHWSRDPSASYGWPLRLAMLVTVTTYVLAGVAKLRIGGVDWMLGDTLRNHIAYSAARLEVFGEASSPIGRAVIPFGVWLRPFAVATVLLELAAPVALLGGRIRTTWVVLTWGMHAAIAALMIVVFPFPLFGVAFACFFRLERLPAALGRLWPPRWVGGRRPTAAGP